MRRGLLALAAAVVLLGGCGGSNPHVWTGKPGTRRLFAATPTFAVALHWSGVTISGGSGFYVTCAPAGGGNCPGQTGVQVADVAAGPYTLTGLQCSTTYTLGVQAHDSSATGYTASATAHTSTPFAATYQAPSCNAGPQNCLKNLQTLGTTEYPVWTSVIACGYPAPTSVDPIGATSGGTAGVPAGTSLQNVSTCSSCLPSGDSWNSSGGYLFVDGTGTLNDVYVPGSVYIATTSPVTIQNTNIDVPAGGSGYAVNGNGDSGVVIKNSWVHTTYSGQTCTQTATVPSGSIGIGNFGNGTWRGSPDLTLTNDDVDCFGIGVENADMTITGSVIISDGLNTTPHDEPIYSGHDDTITGDTIINPEVETAEIFGDQNCGGCSTITNMTIENNLLAGNQNDGGVNVGCTAIGGTPMDFGHGPNTNVTVTGNRFSIAYNTYWGAPFLAGNTDGQPGTTWSGNFMDNDLTTVTEPVNPC